MVAKETIVDGGGWKYANSQFSNQNRQLQMQSAGCRLCIIAPEAQGQSTDGLAAEPHSHINSAGCKGIATTFWLPTTPSGGTCMTACMLHKSQKASSSLSRLTNKVT